jgi:hypothetical protein
MSREEQIVRETYAEASYTTELGSVNQAVQSSRTLSLSELENRIHAGTAQFQIADFKLQTIQQFGKAEAGDLVLEPAAVGRAQIKYSDSLIATSEGPRRSLQETEADAYWGTDSDAGKTTAYTLADDWAKGHNSWVANVATFTVTVRLGKLCAGL